REKTSRVLQPCSQGTAKTTPAEIRKKEKRFGLQNQSTGVTWPAHCLLQYWQGRLECFRIQPVHEARG
ncbi:MAG TPA: hypothetical protein VET88_04180, partial [Gammaproteobacteria bacterium]|nr:hypothetical protein [Gammaproteobacteria bacterium]